MRSDREIPKSENSSSLDESFRKKQNIKFCMHRTPTINSFAELKYISACESSQTLFNKKKRLCCLIDVNWNPWPEGILQFYNWPNIFSDHRVCEAKAHHFVLQEIESCLKSWIDQMFLFFSSRSNTYEWIMFKSSRAYRPRILNIQLPIFF